MRKNKSEFGLILDYLPVGQYEDAERDTLASGDFGGWPSFTGRTCIRKSNNDQNKSDCDNSMI